MDLCRGPLSMMIWSAMAFRSFPTYWGWVAVSKTSLLTRLISPASHPAACAPMVSQVWQATMHMSEGDAPRARVTSA
jgi:hypothetical protein